MERSKKLGNPGALASLVDVARLENEDQSLIAICHQMDETINPFWLDLSHEDEPLIKSIL